MKKLIVFEGCDGSGKSSCAIELAKQINGVYYKTPPQIFENLRESIEKTKDYNLRFYYYLSGTIYAANEIITLLNYNHVVCDRYIYSTIAYHRALGVSITDGLEKTVTQPDYAFCLQAKEEEIIKRIGQRKNLSAFDTAFDFQKKVYQEFKKFPLEFFDTTNLNVFESVERLLKKIFL
jgi:dTMP kinase